MYLDIYYLKDGYDNIFITEYAIDFEYNTHDYDIAILDTCMNREKKDDLKDFFTCVEYENHLKTINKFIESYDENSDIVDALDKVMEILNLTKEVLEWQKTYNNLQIIKNGVPIVV